MIRVLVLVIFCVGCSATPQMPEALPAPEETTPLVYSRGNSELPFNVSIVLFTNQNTHQGAVFFEPIRAAEAAYFPVQLRDTLNESGYWGSVNVVPSKDVAAEVMVTATIAESSAVSLVLDVNVTDSRGKVWFDQTFRDVARDYSETDPETSEDPFQDLFNRISNQMGVFVEQLSEDERGDILDVSMLKYALLLSPEAFSGYLNVEADKTVSLAGLPARNDPLYNRVREIRERETAMQDVVDAHFENFHEDMQSVYPYWRQSSYELLVYNDELSRRERSKKRGSWAAVEDVYRFYRESKLNEDELRELASSFERELEPTVAELEGRVIELQGSLSTQYKTWRRLLREIYSETRGLSAY